MKIGRTVASNRFPNTMDSFWFVVEPNTIVNPFDFVTVENVRNTKSIGMVQYLRTFITDRDDGGSVDSDAQSSILARAVVMTTTTSTIGTNSDHASIVSINLPVGFEKPVRFANAEEIKIALGIPFMSDPIPAGIIENSDGLSVPISLDISYLLGPDTAHVNASGISGNSKTSYLMFLLQSIYQKLKKEQFVLILFNTKDQELLHVHEDEIGYTETSKQKFFELLDLELKPFQNVTYFLPRGKDGKPNSLYVPNQNTKTYSYELGDVYDRLELLFSEIYDPHHNLSSIINYIYESWPIKQKARKKVKTWTDLYKFNDYPPGIITHKSTLLYFQAHLQRFRKSAMFVDKKLTSTYLGKEIKGMNSGDVFIIDIAMLSSLEEQSFIIGDVMKSINELYAARSQTNYQNEQNERNDWAQKITPKYVLIFIDEVNRFVPNDRPGGKLNAVADQIMKSLIGGRSRGTILFSAQQFKSTVDYALHENTGTHIVAKLGLSELATFPYNSVDKYTKSNIVRLNKGELVLVHPAFRYPIRIKFPKAYFGN
jgi:DNA helicase HerA-like ATPase